MTERKTSNRLTGEWYREIQVTMREDGNILIDIFCENGWVNWCGSREEFADAVLYVYGEDE